MKKVTSEELARAYADLNDRIQEQQRASRVLAMAREKTERARALYVELFTGFYGREPSV